MPVFVDTNVLVYARDASEPQKQQRAHDWLRHLWERGTGRLSIQVLEEYYVTVTRKLRPGLPPGEARADVRDLAAWGPVTVDTRTLDGAWSIEERFGLSFWDALIVTSAQVAGCEVLLTEDLQHEVDLDGVQVLDPFQTLPGSIP